jgi:hypothetical protein
MNHKLILFLVLTNCGIAQDPFQLAKFTIKVVSEEKKPIQFARLKISSYERESPEAVFFSTKTDANGKYLFNRRVWQEGFVRSVTENYYENEIGFGFTSRSDGKWQPFDSEITLIIAKKINPVPMYAISRLKTELPRTEPTGFDLVRHDWVFPEGERVKPTPEELSSEPITGVLTRGLGVETDILFSVERTGDAKNGAAKLKLSFPRPGDGIIPVKDWPVTNLFREAPLEGYLPEFVWEEEWETYEGTNLTKEGWQKGENIRVKSREGNPPPVAYYFRVRTVLDEKGKVVSALYGKIPHALHWGVKDMEWRTDTQTACISIGYYLNPDGTRNLEFDPKKNLFKDLTADSQKPRLP